MRCALCYSGAIVVADAACRRSLVLLSLRRAAAADDDAAFQRQPCYAPPYYGALPLHTLDDSRQLRRAAYAAAPCHAYAA